RDGALVRLEVRPLNMLDAVESEGVGAEGRGFSLGEAYVLLDTRAFGDQDAGQKHGEPEMGEDHAQYFRREPTSRRCPAPARNGEDEDTETDPYRQGDSCDRLQCQIIGDQPSAQTRENGEDEGGSQRFERRT